MTAPEILSHVDHTLLKATASWEEIRKLCTEALQYRTASVCIPPSYVRTVYETFGDSLTICTVIGFPLGYNTTAVKVIETNQALMDGAAEIDMVINCGNVKNGRFDAVAEEISAIKKITGTKILKVIIETCFLTEPEKIRLCGIVTESGADYIKTSTGFGSAGAVLSDIALFRKHIGSDVKIKAAGGIKTKEAFEAFLEAGCDRIGSSSAVTLFATEKING
ncbi:deoxyribose-phosphate aldolase [Spirochaetia bacterium]|nr:deoxyribose-phosphate aldolase [Spirochaetia bacterium]